MRARDFITEEKSDIHDSFAWSSPGAFGGVDKYYQLYRLGMLMARHPGSFEDSHTAEGYFGDNVFVGTYTDIDQQKMQAAMKAFGIKPITHTKPGSLETPDTNVKSPIKAFRGYPR